LQQWRTRSTAQHPRVTLPFRELQPAEVAAMRTASTRKRPASAISTASPDQVQELKNQTRTSSSPQIMNSPSLMQMQPTQMPGHVVADYVDPTSNYSPGLYGSPYYNPPQTQKPAENLGTELVRAQTSNQIVPIANYTDGYPMTRPEFGGPPPPPENRYQGQGDPDDLDHRALLAQQDAQAKRKQIPPFVQKLSR